MRKIIAGLFISLDGVVEAPETWHFPYFNDEMMEAVSGQMAQSDSMLLGRVTYEGFAGYWPNVTAEEELPMAAYMNNTPKYVVSTTLDKVEWQNSTLLEGDFVESITRLKQQPGKDISITGSVVLVRSLIAADLLDELRLLIHPIIVGHGQRLFEDGGQKPLKLIESKTFSTGVISASYQPA